MDTVWATNSREQKLDTILGPLYSLTCLFADLDIPVAALSDVWPRAWAWSEWFFRYHNYIPAAHQPGMMDLSLMFLRLLRRIMATADLEDLVRSTPGIRVVISKAWRILLVGLSDDIILGVHDLCQFLYQDATAKSNHAETYLEEYIDGAGGSADDLASLVVLHINCLARRNPTFLSAAVLFTSKTATDEGSLLPALVSLGFVKSLTAALSLLLAKSVESTVKLQVKCLTLLASILSTPVGFPLLGPSLSSGLLSTIALSARNLRSDDELVPLRLWLVHVLPGAIACHSVLGHIHAALTNASDIAVPEKMASPHIRELWNVFVGLVHDHVEIKAQFDSPEYIATRACDNTMCGQIQDKDNLRRCANCRRAYYCSRECQRMDWNDGHHRDICSSLRVSYLAHAHVARTRDMSFQRALLDHHYARNKLAIFRAQIALINANRHDPDFVPYTSFTYSADGAPAIVTNTLTEHVRGVSEVHYRCRVNKSAGLMELHSIVIHTGGQILRRLFPLRSADSRVHDGVRAVADGIAAGTLTPDEVDAELLWLARLDVRTVH
ncbi:hypothetical protein FB451DRAFT_1240747 [Mycena latifolia]|nr:hypothetical protein FB451DRAFT_1240747 [Mycena latifolia]